MGPKFHDFPDFGPDFQPHLGREGPPNVTSPMKIMKYNQIFFMIHRKNTKNIILLSSMAMAAHTLARGQPFFRHLVRSCMMIMIVLMMMSVPPFDSASQLLLHSQLRSAFTPSSRTGNNQFSYALAHPQGQVDETDGQTPDNGRFYGEQVYLSTPAGKESPTGPCVSFGLVSFKLICFAEAVVDIYSTSESLHTTRTYIPTTKGNSTNDEYRISSIYARSRMTCT